VLSYRKTKKRSVQPPNGGAYEFDESNNRARFVFAKFSFMTNRDET